MEPCPSYLSRSSRGYTVEHYFPTEPPDEPVGWGCVGGWAKREADDDEKPREADDDETTPREPRRKLKMVSSKRSRES